MDINRKRAGSAASGLDCPDAFSARDKWVVRFCTVSLGAASLWAQVLVIRFGLVAFGGNELVVGLLFGFWLFAVGSGALAGGLTVKLFRSHVPLLLACVFLLLAFSLYSEFFLARGLRAFVGLPAGECPALWQIAAGVALVTIPVSFFVGFVFPLLSEMRCARARGAGEVYALEAAGSLAAACSGTYLFLADGREDLLVFWAVFLLLASSALFFRYRRTEPGRRASFTEAAKGNTRGAKLTFLLLVVWLCLGIWNLQQLKEWTNSLRWHGLEGFVLQEEMETPYGNAAVLRRRDQYQLYLDGQLVFSFPDPVEEEKQAHVAATEAVSLETVCVFGGRPGLVRELCKYEPETVHVVRLDAALQDLLRRYMGEETRKAFENERVRLRTADPRMFLKSMEKDSCDLMLLTMPEPSSAGLNRFYTVEFFNEVNRVLSPSGVFSFSVNAGIHLEDDTARFAGTFLKNLHAVFPEVVLTAGSEICFFAAGGPDVVTADPRVLMGRFSERGVETNHFKKYFFLATDAFQEDKIAFTERRLTEAAQKVRADRDAMPRLFVRRLVVFSRKAGLHLAACLEAILGLSPWAVIPWAVLPGFFVFLMKRRDAMPFVVTVWTTGFWGMSLEILLLFMFQIQAGVLYYKIGMLTGSFMFGLSMGALLGCRVRRYRRSFLLLESSSVLVAALTPGIPFLIAYTGAFQAEVLFYAWASVAGLITGCEFSVSNIVITERTRRVDKTGIVAALTDGADHLGACLGALLTGVVLLPAIGIHGTVLFLVFLKAGTSVAFWANLR